VRAEKAAHSRANIAASKDTPAPNSTPAIEKKDVDKPRDGTEALGPDAYLAEVKKLLAAENFDELDRIANSARAKKSRFPGGGWKLRTFYLSLCGECDESSEADLIANIEHLKHWVANKPESITARVALTEAYISYAWYARGVEFADLVDDNASVLNCSS
jgi:hypothetical protein